jgi:hypothetical protein
VLDPFPQMTYREQDAFWLAAAARVALLPAGRQRFFLLLGLQLRQQERVTHADFIFGKGFDRCGNKLGQAKA